MASTHRASCPNKGPQARMSDMSWISTLPVCYAQNVIASASCHPVGRESSSTLGKGRVAKRHPFSLFVAYHSHTTR